MRRRAATDSANACTAPWETMEIPSQIGRQSAGASGRVDAPDATTPYSSSGPKSGPKSGRSVNFDVANLNRMRLTSQDTGSPSSVCASTPKFIGSKAGTFAAGPHSAATHCRAADGASVGHTPPREVSGGLSTDYEEICTPPAAPLCMQNCPLRSWLHRSESVDGLISEHSVLAWKRAW